ncbi:MAG: class I SAM-dependent methyltransferase [Treponemataceae bacterium]|nr:class I SAM-dependent methyltransferase [Treponemataceae bacterium]
MGGKDAYQAELFQNRLVKKYRRLRKWARKNNVSCYRVYDRDIPEVPVVLDVYEFLPEEVGSTESCARFLAEQSARYAANDPLVEEESARRRYAVLSLYERPYEKPEDEERAWLELAARAAAAALHIPPERVVCKERRRQKGAAQYEKAAPGADIAGMVQEQGQLFHVNLSKYIDTGLFFDHRPLRALIRETSAGKDVLNLFCYTGSFSVYAAQGNARRVVSVDLSNTYLAWARGNMACNGFSDAARYLFVKSDVLSFLDAAASRPAVGGGRYGIIVLDPPTFSNSKSGGTLLDINRDWSLLVSKCLSLLADDGVLYFSTNSRKLSIERRGASELLHGRDGLRVRIEDITEASVPEDCKGVRSHRCWKIFLEKDGTPS